MNKFFQGLKTFIAFISALLLVILILVSAITVNVTGFFKTRNVTKIVNEISVTDIIKSDKKTWNNITSSASGSGVSEEALSNIIDGSNLKAILSEYFASMVEVGINDGELAIITKEEVSEAISKDIDKYNKKNDKAIDNTTKANILNFIESNYDEIKGSFPTKEEVVDYFNDDDIKEVKDFINTLNEHHFTTWLIIISLLFMGIILACKFGEYKFLRYYGVSFLAAGLSVLIAGVILLMLDSLVLEMDADKVVIDMVMVIKNNVASNLNITAIILIVISIFLFFLKKGLSSYNKPAILESSPVMNEVEKAMIENQVLTNENIENEK